MQSTKIDLERSFKKHLNLKPERVQERPGGANSRVFKVTDVNKRLYLAKAYLGIDGQDGKRLKTEFESLKFLWNHKLRRIPEPIFADKEICVGVYSFVEGRPFLQDEIDQKSILEAIRFVCDLQGLPRRQDSWEIPVAKEACFSMGDYMDSLRRRLGPLKEIREPALKSYVEDDLEKTMDTLTHYISGRCRANRIPMEEALPNDQWALSPSDVGYHNILQRDKDKALVFIDFEYFGWDDPVKMICDFVLQPENPIPESQRRFFIAEYMREFPTTVDLKARFPLVFPILSMRWCLIMLNAFLPNRHKSFSGTELSDFLQKSKKHLGVLSQRLQSGEHLHWVNLN